MGFRRVLILGLVLGGLVLAVFILSRWLGFELFQGKRSPSLLYIDRGFDFPKGFVPDPGELGQKTIQGVDSDQDGVRDDVQRWIYATHPRSKEKRNALRQVARYYQLMIKEDLGMSRFSEFWMLLLRSNACLFKRFGNDGVLAHRYGGYLKARILNTIDRTQLFLRHDQNLFSYKKARSIEDQYMKLNRAVCDE